MRSISLLKTLEKLATARRPTETLKSWYNCFGRTGSRTLATSGLEDISTTLAVVPRIFPLLMPSLPQHPRPSTEALSLYGLRHDTEVWNGSHKGAHRTQDQTEPEARNVCRWAWALPEGSPREFEELEFPVSHRWQAAGYGPWPISYRVARRSSRKGGGLPGHAHQRARSVGGAS